MTILPKCIKPGEFAKRYGLSERFVRDLARRIGACRVLGNRMILLPEDVKALQDAIGTEGLKKSQKRLYRMTPSFVYFIAAQGFIKIGWSENWKSRLANIGVSNPDPIKILLVLNRPQSFETEMHALFNAHSHRGEWFKDHPEIRAFIKLHANECLYRARRK